MSNGFRPITNCTCVTCPLLSFVTETGSGSFRPKSYSALPNASAYDFDLLPAFRTKLSMISAKERGSEMSRSRHTEAQMIGALKQLEAGRKAEDVAREVGVSKHTIYAWKASTGVWT